jgi:uncharacterized membrane protein
MPVSRPLTVAPWLPLSSIVLSVAGLGVSAYLTVEHFTASTTLACPATRVVNCLAVTNSPQSTAMGVPLPILGLAFFAAMLALGLGRAWASPSPVVRRARLAAAALGVAFVFYLVYVELFVLDAICLWCTAVHALTIALFAVVAWGTATTADP